MGLAKITLLILTAIILTLYSAFVFYHGWNWFMPEIGVQAITFNTSLGISALANLILSGFYKTSEDPDWGEMIIDRILVITMYLVFMFTIQLFR